MCVKCGGDVNKHSARQTSECGGGCKQPRPGVQGSLQSH